MTAASSGGDLLCRGALHELALDHVQRRQFMVGHLEPRDARFAIWNSLARKFST
jgi:hypothetical protein